jgi:hypothetical protein
MSANNNKHVRVVVRTRPTPNFATEVLDIRSEKSVSKVSALKKFSMRNKYILQAFLKLSLIEFDLQVAERKQVHLLLHDFFTFQIINVHFPKPEDAGFIHNQHLDWSFKYDKVLHNSSQELVYDECAHQVVHSVLEGYNGALNLV